jgi:hypothetical protein
VAVGRTEEKNANVHVCVFFVQGGVLPPPPPHCRTEAYYARPDFCLPIMHSVIRPRLTHSEAASPEDAYPLEPPGHKRPGGGPLFLAGI